MSSKEDELSQELEEELDLNYKAPPQKSLQELIEADKEDASLAKYKESLLGNAISGGLVVGRLFTVALLVVFCSKY